MTFRTATPADITNIASLHARSWRENYADSLPQEYLENQVPAERLAVWTQRLNEPSHNRWTLLAEEDEKLLGFICLETEHDPEWGTLLDNLHVNSDYQGRGIGRALMEKAARYLNQEYPHTGMYLWVISNNATAIGFYQKLGGRQAGPARTYELAGFPTEVLRYVWAEGEVQFLL